MKKIFKKLLQNCDLFKGKMNGFTLAEVLITLGIIGIVAAMTIPTLVKKYQDKVFETKNKKTMAILSNGFKMLMANQGVSRIRDLSMWEAQVKNMDTSEFKNITQGPEMQALRDEERRAEDEVFDRFFDSRSTDYDKLDEELEQIMYEYIDKQDKLYEKAHNLTMRFTGLDKVFKIQSYNFCYNSRATAIYQVPNSEQTYDLSDPGTFVKGREKTYGINQYANTEFTTVDGTYVRVLLPWEVYIEEYMVGRWNNTPDDIVLVVDLNGPNKKPNIVGKDLHVYKITQGFAITDITASEFSPLTFDDVAKRFQDQMITSPLENICESGLPGGKLTFIDEDKFRCTAASNICFESSLSSFVQDYARGYGHFEGHPCN